MKKLVSFLLLAATGLMLTACIAPNPVLIPNGNGYIPYNPPTPTSSSGAPSSSSGGSESRSSSSSTSSESSSSIGSIIEVRFYLDYSHSNDDDVYKVWVGGIGELIPEPDRPTADQCPDPAFPTFLGWCKQPLLDDKNGLWDFENDRTPDQRYLSIYGIWISNE